MMFEKRIESKWSLKSSFSFIGFAPDQTLIDKRKKWTEKKIRTLSEPSLALISLLIEEKIILLPFLLKLKFSVINLQTLFISF
jgi:hypothetical protein